MQYLAPVGSLLTRSPSLLESIITMIGTFNNAISTLEIWFFNVSRMKPGCTSLICDWRGPSSCTRLQDPGHIAYSAIMARRFQTPGVSSIYDVFILSLPRHLPSSPGDQNFQYNSVLLVYDQYYVQVC
jgi:hypothetical protein